VERPSVLGPVLVLPERASSLLLVSAKKKIFINCPLKKSLLLPPIYNRNRIFLYKVVHSECRIKLNMTEGVPSIVGSTFSPSPLLSTY
jgi:hypothetical protein